MAENLPTPESRKELYLAKAAGEDVTVPTPASREELFLNAIAEGGGGGGGTTYTAGDGITISDDTIAVDLVQTTGTDTKKVMSQDAVTTALASAGGDTVYSTKTTSDGATGGAVYIGNLDATQTEQTDPTTTDSHKRYFWALPSNNTRIPPDYSINIFGSVDGANNGLYNTNSIILGSGATAYAASGIAIGKNAKADGDSVAIGSYAGGGDWSGKVGMVAIGEYAIANQSNYVIHIGGNSGTSYGVRGGSSDNSIAIGKNSMISNLTNSVALGAYSQATRQGEVNVGLVTGETTGGYNNTAYRLISGVHDPVGDHDAATKGYVDANAGGVTVLSSEDYNWPSDNPNGIALWLLEPGYYVAPSTGYIKVYKTNGSSTNIGQGYSYPSIFVVKKAVSNASRGTYLYFNLSTYDSNIVSEIDENGQNSTFYNIQVRVVDNLTSSNTDRALSANQGKELKALIDGLDQRITALGG